MKRFFFSFILASGVAFGAILLSRDFAISPTVLASGISTNIAPASIDLASQMDKSQVLARISVSCKGGTGATNANSVIVYFSTSRDGTVWDTASLSNIKMTLTPEAGSTVTKSDWFNLTSIKEIRVGRIENNSSGSISNLSATLTLTP